MFEFFISSFFLETKPETAVEEENTDTGFRRIGGILISLEKFVKAKFYLKIMTV